MLENLRPLFERERASERTIWLLSNFSVFTFHCVHKQTNIHNSFVVFCYLSLCLRSVLNIYFISSFYRKISINIYILKSGDTFFSEFLKLFCRSSEGKSLWPKKTQWVVWCGKPLYDITVLILRDLIEKEQNILHSQTNGMSDTGQR